MNGIKNPLSVRTARDLKGLHLNNVTRPLSEDQITHLLTVADAFWMHSGDMSRPHAELTAGKHSNGFVDALRLLRFTNICEILADALSIEIEGRLVDLEDSEGIDWVIGSDHAGAAFSHSVATIFNAQHDFTEKGPNGTQIWKRFPIQPGERVLQVEELVTTAHTMEAVRAGVRAGSSEVVEFLPLVATFVHRSSVTEIEDCPIVYLVHYDIESWEPKDCPLCKAGSKAIKPKQNWAELTGR